MNAKLNGGFLLSCLSLLILTMGCSKSQGTAKENRGARLDKTMDLRIPAAASSAADALYDQSYLSVNKGDCRIENARNFSPAIESFKILVPSKAFQQDQGEGFLYYNVLATSVGVMSPAEYRSNRNTGEQSLSAKILLGLSEVAGIELKFNFSNAGPGAKTHGTIDISKSGRVVFSSNFTCE